MSFANHLIPCAVIAVILGVRDTVRYQILVHPWSRTVTAGGLILTASWLAIFSDAWLQLGTGRAILVLGVSATIGIGARQVAEWWLGSERCCRLEADAHRTWETRLVQAATVELIGKASLGDVIARHQLSPSDLEQMYFRLRELQIPMATAMTSISQSDIIDYYFSHVSADGSFADEYQSDLIAMIR